MFKFKELLDKRAADIARAISQGAWQDPFRCARRSGARHRGGGVRLRHPASPEGRVLAQCRAGDRHPFRPPAARRLRRHHAVQLPRHGAAVDASGGDRLRQHLRAEAVGARSFRADAGLRAVQGGRLPRRRAECRAWRQGGGRRHPRPSRHQGGELRRLHPDRPLRLYARHRGGEARAGAGRRQEPHDRHARRRHGQGGGRADGRRLRLRRRALHGDLRRRAGRRGDGEPAGRDARAEGALAEDRPGHRSGRGDGPARHRSASEEGARLYRRRA